MTTTATRRHRWGLWAVVGVVVVTAAVITAALTPPTSRGDLDPNSAGRDGARAVVQVLRGHGIRVEAVRRSQQAVANAPAGATLVVVHPELLGPDQLARVGSSPADLVLVAPDLVTLDALAPRINPAGTVPTRTAAPACPDPDAQAAGAVSAGGHLYGLTASRSPGALGAATSSAQRCYPDAGPDGGYALIRVAPAGRRITVLGQPDLLRNATLAEHGNAALALRVLGARARLVWYLPDPAETSGGSPGLLALLPPWVGWVAAQLLIALTLTLVWRARRFGRVVTEPLPVVVRSVETEEGRARLYRQGRARDLAAAVLRTAALRRLAARLGVPPHAQPHRVAALAAAAAGTPDRTTADVLLGGPPPDDASLVALAAALDTLEQQVSHPATQYRDRAGSPAAPEPRREARA